MFQNWQNKFFYEANTGANGGGDNPPAEPKATGEGEPKPEKTYTQKELNDILAKEKGKFEKLSQSKIAEIEEAQKLAKMSETERQAAEYKKLQEENETYKREKLVFEFEKQLSEKGLPSGLAKYVSFKDADSASVAIKGIDEVIKAHDAPKDARIKELEQQLTNANLRGTTPKAVTGTPGEITPQEFNKMGYANRLEIKNKNPELYNKLTNKK